jgi:hypothetical protein
VRAARGTSVFFWLRLAKTVASDGAKNFGVDRAMSSKAGAAKPTVLARSKID